MVERGIRCGAEFGGAGMRDSYNSSDARGEERRDATYTLTNAMLASVGRGREFESEDEWRDSGTRVESEGELLVWRRTTDGGSTAVVPGANEGCENEMRIGSDEVGRGGRWTRERK
ncbi:hypothetical protein PIB30_105351, partial [Stylosanthes scabra]|nr:hypothetical protein [Stylosanthes scabra]